MRVQSVEERIARAQYAALRVAEDAVIAAHREIREELRVLTKKIADCILSYL